MSHAVVQSLFPAPAAAPQDAAWPELSSPTRLDPWAAQRLLAAFDWLAVIAAAWVCAHVGLHPATVLEAPFGAVLIALAGPFSLKAGLWLVDAYQEADLHRRAADRSLGGVALGAFAGLIACGALAPDPVMLIAAATTVPVAALVIAAAHAAAAAAFHRAARTGALTETVVIVGATQAAARLIQKNKQDPTLRVVGVFDDRTGRRPDAIEGVPVLGSIEDLIAWPQLPQVDRIVLCVSQTAQARVRDLAERLRLTPNRVDLLLDLDGLSEDAAAVEPIASAAGVRLSGAAPDRRRILVKRAADLVIGSALLVLLAPVMALIAAAVRLDSRGPVLFRQKRQGHNNRVITVYKFRTMHHAPETAGWPVRQVQPNDPRVTRIGGFLRRTSLDELPQLFNVLQGDMSLVGPRPHAVGMLTGAIPTETLVRDYAHRHRIKPGVTGWAQVNGSRGPIETPEAVRERLRLDMEYIARASLWLDLWIMFRTVPALLGDRIRTR